MQRGDVAVLSISSVLAAIVVVAVTFSVRVLDRTPSAVDFAVENSNSSWLVLTWGPSLCKANPGNRGCESGQVAEMGRTWILHGLWPQPAENQYCGVPKKVADRARKIHAADMPSVQLQDDVRSTVQSMMSDASIMAPHEWYSHGTCSGVTPDVFFSDAAMLTEQARQALDPMFKDAEGDRMSLSDVRDKFDDEYGQGAGERVRLSCRNLTGEGSVVYELHLSLPPVTDLRIDGDALPLKDLILKGPPIGPGCRHASVP
jgi:ribonuclease T2